MKIHHVCIETPIYKESLDFYINVLGFNLAKETPNFHGREYNTWLELNGFYIELQTPKKGQLSIDKGDNKIVHMCFYVENIEKKLEEILKKYNRFKLKNNEIIYEVEGGKLLKIIAPEETVIEIRDNPLF